MVLVGGPGWYSWEELNGNSGRSWMVLVGGAGGYVEDLEGAAG